MCHFQSFDAESLKSSKGATIKVTIRRFRRGGLGGFRRLCSNCLFAVSLDVVTGEKARRTVAACEKHLVVPGAIRSLAPLQVEVPLPVKSTNGELLNDPQNPYWGICSGAHLETSV